MKKQLFLFLIPATAALLAACGDDIENNTINQMGMEVVASDDDLPECSDENEGDQAFVKDEDAVRVCVGGKWKPVLPGGSGNSDLSCKTVELKDKSGLKIVCNGDSVGVVLNGSDGKDAVLPQDTLEADSERVAISLDSLVGVTQKGPFLKGSTVYLYELSDGRTLKQTNGNFTSNITSNDGRYKFTARDLVSQYAMVVVDGYYRNEVTGNISDAPIRLKAITDMRKRNSVNVNILTQLEFDRVYSLVTRGDKDGNKLTVKQAKRQAQKEILKLFDIELDDDTDAEDMDVFGKTDADAALLAISVLLQGDTSATDLSVILTEISNAFAEKGTWTDSMTKAGLADWALKADSENRLALFRKNVAGWHLGDTVPEFEKFVRNYVNVESGLGTCGDKKNPVGTFAHVPNKKSGYYAKAYDSIDATKNSLVRFVCDDKGGKHWRIATDLERDTKGWEKDSAGTVRKGQIDTSLTYVYEDGWRHGTDLDRVVGFGCIKAFKDSVAEVSDSSWYACTVSKDEGHAWHLMSNREKDSVFLKAYNDKDSIPGLLLDAPFTKKTLVWDADTLREANDYEILLKKACVTSKYGTRDSLSNTLTYTCDESGWSKTGTFADRRISPYITYKAVQIGNQVWMAENLNHREFIHIPFKYVQYYDSYEIASNESDSISWCFDNVYANCAKYGRLYTWAAAMDSSGSAGSKGNGCGTGVTCSPTYPVKGVCPYGWHLPDTTEWSVLSNAVGGSMENLKSQTGWGSNGNGLDAYAFTALPAGLRNPYGGYEDEARSVQFWSSTQGGTTHIAYIFRMSSTYMAPMITYAKYYGFSVRCVKD